VEEVLSLAKQSATGWMTGFALILCLGSLLRFGLGNDAAGVNFECDAFASQSLKDPFAPFDASKQTNKLIEAMSFEEMMNKVKTADGFLAALDQSGGSTPKALRIYGIPDSVSSEHLCWFGSLFGGPTNSADPDAFSFFKNRITSQVLRACMTRCTRCGVGSLPVPVSVEKR
jgi:hypothetical protein